MMRLLATCLLCILSFGGFPSHVQACAIALGAYDERLATAAITATVTRVWGSGFRGTYSLERIAIIRPAPGSLALSTRLRINMADYVMGTCGSQSPVLKAGDQIVLYFEIVDGNLRPSGWKHS